MLGITDISHLEIKKTIFYLRFNITVMARSLFATLVEIYFSFIRILQKCSIVLQHVQFCHNCVCVFIDMYAFMHEHWFICILLRRIMFANVQIIRQNLHRFIVAQFFLLQWHFNLEYAQHVWINKYVFEYTSMHARTHRHTHTHTLKHRYECMHTQTPHIYTCMHAHLNTNRCMHSHLNACTHVCLHTYSYMHTCTHAHLHMHMCMHIHSHLCMNAHSNTHTHICMHSQTHPHKHMYANKKVSNLILNE